MTVPFLDLPRMHQPLLDEIDAAISGLIAEARFIGGPAITAFEQAFARTCDVKGCVGVGNGTDALTLALKVLGIGPGDEVVVPAHTFIATAEAVSNVGATPRFVDIDEKTYTLDPKCLAAVDTTKVKAVMPVHLYGQPADLDPIMTMSKKHGWRVIEDCAQAHAARYGERTAGSMGDLAGFSFYPGKNLGAFGDGGAVVGNDLELLDRLRRVADHGRQTKQAHGEIGLNSRLDSIQAAVLGIKLKHLDDWNRRRARAASWYDERLAGISGLTVPYRAAGRTHIYHLYVVLVPDRNALQSALNEVGIQSGIHYAIPLHLQPAYAHLGYAAGDFPVSERVTATCLSLPMFPDLEEAQVDQVATAIRDHMRAGG
ncbi:MAG: erythromycin biosynthesis sensory transduction protein eryC1 [Deltaproteobacteria bacterium RIFOXYA12_FULL_58_15]|nr:MAG: erythromycin biosynthesis sensory transduction protein eryC1 [Deltaproteobacteria bacterium RIFOXYA12_FULL_58_15]OGR09831.1 MAG: erythromycin biosynthesis sensory transduction protein eryC1 [Deltaproteobacteria bacterium RIFOXYB12_FULL_58_9]